ncbi:MAG TPA: ABC transporter permease [Tissierellia bacterium]|jgi:peptide/nickel transport system permease protein|nr:ABC transporter permease [Tissierellia bacterium]
MKKISWEFRIGLVLVLLLLGLCIVSLFYTPYGTNQEVGAKFLPPSGSFLFGTDNLGRDVFSRVMVGSQTVFLVGFVSVAIGLVFGVLLGSIAGFAGKWVDEVIMRLMDAMLSFPGILFALMYVAVFGFGIFNATVALGIMAIPRFARITRSGFIQVKQMPYIDLARSIGVSKVRIMFVHILPNIISPLIVAASMGFATAILAEAGLSYLGLGVQPPDPSWGRMLKDSQNSFLSAPHYALAPGLMITLTVLGFNLLGDGIRDIKEVK